MLDSIDRWENEGGRPASNATTASSRSLAAPQARYGPAREVHAWEATTSPNGAAERSPTGRQP